jgi:hypothetical protein
MSDTDEIARLRALWCEEKSKSMTFYAEIERLRADLDLALSAEISRVRLADLAQRTAEVAKANAERDEARREICNVVGRGQGKRLYAAERGWDCFAPHATDVRVQNGGET